MSDKTVADGSIVHPEQFARTLKMNFTKPGTFGFLWFATANGPRLRAGRSALGLGRYYSLLRTVRSRSSEVCIVHVRSSLRCHGWSAGRARTVRAQVNSPKKLSYSE
jgi:hypothetical protein